MTMGKTNLLLLLSFFIFACQNPESEQKENGMKYTENPFLKESTLPYFAPDFTKIGDEDFEPAILEGIRHQLELVAEIADNPEEPTFENTVIAQEKSGELLDRVLPVFYALVSAHTNDRLQEIDEAVAPKLAEKKDAIYLNEALFERIKFLYDRRESLDLDNESLKLLEKYYEDFEIAGANLSPEDKEQLKKLNSELASLTTKFNKTLLAANNAGAVHFTDKEKLKGLSDETLESLEKDGGWTIPLQNTTQQPLLSSMEDRESRQKLFEAAWHRADRGDHDSRDLVLEIVKLRAQKAALLGFDNYAAWSLQNTMAKTPENVLQFFAGLVPATTAKAQAEAEEIRRMAESEGASFRIEPWDWDFYAEKVRRAKYDLDEDRIRPYFEMWAVLEDGVFYAANQLYGLTFEERTDIPVYHEDVRVYELFEESGAPLGLFYADFFARPSKRGGAWMSNFVDQSRLFDKNPVIYNVCNFPEPAEGKPALLTYDAVETMFHEFGHALHGFFADQQYPSLSGTSVARDFVEFPSQFNENWALYPEVLKNYARHYETGEVIPQTLIDKIKKSGTFNQGYSFTELLAAANLDMQWHTISPDEKIEDVTEFEKEALHKTALDVVHAVPPRYRSTYFSHIFAGGYAAGYYSYQWTEMLDHDAYRWFQDHGGLTRENGQRFRDMVLSRGNTLDLEEMYEAWRGQAPEIEPLLVARGLE